MEVDAEDAPQQWWVSSVGLLGLLLYWSQKRRNSEDKHHCLLVLQALLSKTSGQQVIAQASRARVDAIDCECPRQRGRDCPHVCEVHDAIKSAETRLGQQTCAAVCQMLVAGFQRLHCERVREYVLTQLTLLASGIESRKGEWQSKDWQTSPKAVLQGPMRKRRLDPELREHAKSSVQQGAQRDTREAVNSMAGLSSDAAYRFQLSDAKEMRAITKESFGLLRTGSLGISIDAARFRRPGKEYLLAMLASCNSTMGATALPQVLPRICLCSCCCHKCVFFLPRCGSDCPRAKVQKMQVRQAPVLVAQGLPTCRCMAHVFARLSCWLAPQVVLLKGRCPCVATRPRSFSLSIVHPCCSQQPFGAGSSLDLLLSLPSLVVKKSCLATAEPQRQRRRTRVYVQMRDASTLLSRSAARLSGIIHRRLEASGIYLQAWASAKTTTTFQRFRLSRAPLSVLS